MQASAIKTKTIKIIKSVKLQVYIIEIQASKLWLMEWEWHWILLSFRWSTLFVSDTGTGLVFSIKR